MSDPLGSVICPTCARQWQKTSEQGVSIELYDQCVVCKFTPQGNGSNDGSRKELDLVASESLRRRAVKEQGDG